MRGLQEKILHAVATDVMLCMRPGVGTVNIGTNLKWWGAYWSVGKWRSKHYSINILVNKLGALIRGVQNTGEISRTSV